MKGYLFLSISIVSELVATSLLKLSDGMSVLLPSLGVAVGYGLAFYFLSLSLKTIPLSLAYAIWSGVGTALTALIGVVFWGEVLTTLMLVGIVFIIGGVVLLNSSKETEEVQGQMNTSIGLDR
ncbi:multidrug efflux SMR transporter [Robertmurraya korlensis]|uniref:DMT family transporter n=1 Tax=Robertmurraya korlensis TaxID=519977 RepID=UPI00203EBD72|nr:multidrug efflux SMR transporter [Robertmurraya korlensis]MCM3601259.1 multidrug efflux SMR transporter [Robertmurraya korlensis]